MRHCLSLTFRCLSLLFHCFLIACRSDGTMLAKSDILAPQKIAVSMVLDDSRTVGGCLSLPFHCAFPLPFHCLPQPFSLPFHWIFTVFP